MQRQRGLNPEQANVVGGHEITDLMSIDAIYGVGVRFHRLILGIGFPEEPEDGFGVMEIVMHDIH
jgi:hypothetical protein